MLFLRVRLYCFRQRDRENHPVLLLCKRQKTAHVFEQPVAKRKSNTLATFSKRARQFTSKLVYGKVVEVKVMATDRYGRTVAMIYGDKTLLNEELVKAGLAWVYWKYCHHPICESWKNFQIGARMDKRVLWADVDRIPPWEFRRKKRKSGAL